jgi:hypothetical protein
MEKIDIVDELDRIIGSDDIEKIHENSLRHRSVQILVFEHPYKTKDNRILVAERGESMKSSLRLHVSAGGHVKSGLSYLEAALEELREELFYGLDKLPTEIVLHEIARYKNDTRANNKENTTLFITNYKGPFSPDPRETKKIFWRDLGKVRLDMKKDTNKYTKTFINALSHI